MMLNKYLIDANVFIQAKNMYYRFDFCGGFWEWVKTAHGAGLVYTIKKVKDELVVGSDDCSRWIKGMPPSFFLDDINDRKVMAEYSRIMNWSNATDFKQAAKDEFAKPNVADAFLIAVAKAHNYSIVTQEQGNPMARRKIYLPDAAAAHGVETKYVYDMLSMHTSSTFMHKPV